ncbi:hypothetical protein ASD02_36415 [Ensifer sp. Root1252]|nr:hypothetical protein ASD02_36415 [Ensifer sp. Root1252]KRC62209.1 hypothetical protein ASE32_36370 [Ensifer sp. Root231]KRC91034.1 hypothetical protein ASE47_36410 [Ensifer sp. Root258]
MSGARLRVTSALSRAASVGDQEADLVVQGASCLAARKLREKLPALLVEIVGPGKNALVFDPGEAVPALKGHLTDEIIENLGTCTALHGALLANRSGAVLLCGSPGSGKTTLAFAMQRGFQSHADGAITGEKRSSVRGRALRERHFFSASISSDIL